MSANFKHSHSSQTFADVLLNNHGRGKEPPPARPCERADSSVRRQGLASQAAGLAAESVMLHLGRVNTSLDIG